MSYFSKFTILICLFLALFFMTKGLNIDLENPKHHPIALNYYSRIKMMHFCIAFGLLAKSLIIFFAKNPVLSKFLTFSLLIDFVCLLFVERAIFYSSSGQIMNPFIANIIIGLPILILLFNQIYYLYLLIIKRKKIHWQIGFEEILDTKN